MAEYTPTTEEVRRHWGIAVDVHRRGERLAEFDRWLAKEKAKAYAQGVGRTLEVLGTATTPGDGLLTLIGNPYRE